jgi:tetratricopeptide (TPR) repeat protein
MTAKILYNKNRDTAAREYLEKALALGGGRMAAGMARALGNILRERGDNYGAIRAYEQVLSSPYLSSQNDYAITSLVLGNIYTDIARGAPFNLAALRHTWPEATNAKAIFAVLPQLTSEVSAAVQKARGYYQGYVQRAAFDTHKTRGMRLVNALAEIPTTTAGLARRVAHICQEEGEIDLAIAVLKEVLDTKLSARDSLLLMNDLAELLASFGQKEEADAVWEQLVQRYPDDWRSQRAYARRLFTQGELDKSIEAFERASRLAPNNSDTYTILGFLYWQKGEGTKAVQSLQKSLSQNSGNLYSLYYISRIELERGNTAEAISYGERLLENFKRSMGQNYADDHLRALLLDTLALLARSCFRTGHITRCLEYAYEGIDLDKDNTYAFLALAGDVRVLQQKYDDAEQYYARAVQADPGNAIYRLKWAEAMLSSGKEAEAIHVLDKLYYQEILFTKRRELLLLYADALAKRGRNKDAARVLESLISEQAYSEAGYLALARLLTGDNQTGAALAVLERGIAYIKNAPLLKDALAWLLGTERPEELVRARQIAMENTLAHPGNVDFRATLGYILLRLGQSASATKPIKLEEAGRLARARPPHPALGSITQKAMHFYRAARYAEALETIAAGEGNHELMRTNRAAEKLFAYLLTK